MIIWLTEARGKPLGRPAGPTEAGGIVPHPVSEPQKKKVEKSKSSGPFAPATVPVYTIGQETAAHPADRCFEGAGIRRHPEE